MTEITLTLIEKNMTFELMKIQRMKIEFIVLL